MVASTAWSTCPTSPWQASGEDLVRNFKKGDEIEAVVLAGSGSGARAHLARHYVMEQDPFGQFMASNPRGTIVNGTVKEVDAKGATIDLGEGVEGYLRANDIAKERIDDATQHLKVGDKVEAKFTGMDARAACCSSRSARRTTEVQDLDGGPRSSQHRHHQATRCRAGTAEQG